MSIVRVQLGGQTVPVQVLSSGFARANEAVSEAAASAASAAASAAAASATLAAAALKANNLSDLTSASTARANLGLGSIATQSASAVAITGGAIAGITDLAVADGGTGASTAATARDNLGVSKSVTIDQFAGATDAIKLQAAFDANPTQIVFDRDVSVNAAVTSNGNVRLIGTGETLTFTSTGSLTVGTGVTRIADLSVNVALDATTLTFGTSHGLAVNDVVAVWNPTDFSFGPARDYYREGDMYQVAEVISSTQVRIYGQAQQAMTAASFEVYKLNGGSFEIDGLDIVPSAGTQTPLYLDGLVDVRLNNLKMAAGGGATAVEIFRCYDIGVDAPDVRTTVPTDSYPITISNSQKVTITNVRGLHSEWHSIALGGRDGNGTVPTADVIIADSILENDASTGIPAADIHGGCKRITYDGGFICGASMNGRDVTIRNARVLMTAPSSNNGICVQGSEVVGGTYTLENCELISGAIGVSFASHINLGVSAITSDLRLIVRNCTLQHTGSSGTAAGASLIRLELGAGALTPDILVDIDGLTYIGEAAPLTLLSLTGAGSLSAGSVVRIANVTGIDRVVAATNAANYNVSFSGPGITKGVTYQGDAGVTLTRASTTTQDFNTTLTADRFCDLPFGAACAGDEFTITRSGGGDGFNVIVRSATSPRIVALGQGSWVRLQFKGAGAGGEWVVAARGQTGGLYGVRLFGDVSAFIELTRTSQFFGRQTNIWDTPLTTNRSVSFDAGARRGDIIRVVRTAAATGAFDLSVPHGAGTKLLAAGQFCEIIYDGTSWYVTAAGSL